LHRTTTDCFFLNLRLLQGIGKTRIVAKQQKIFE
jgi:hypothetical protein